MSADNFAHPNAKGPTGTFDLLGLVDVVKQEMVGEFSLLVRGGTSGKECNYFLALSEASGHFASMPSRYLTQGAAVYSQLPPPQASEQIRDFKAEFCNNRIFLTPLAAP